MPSASPKLENTQEIAETAKPVIQYAVPTAQQSKDIAQKMNMLEAAFTQIHQQRMNDVPILNNKIKVAAVGFHLWEGSYIGIMITPWFMNLMLLPGDEQDWDELQELSKQSHIFPSGRYTFITGYEADIGKYQMCSLFSPMFEFADNTAALDTAEAAIKELLNVDNIELTDIDSKQIEGIWNGTEVHPDKVDAIAEAEALNDAEKTKILEQKTLSEKLETPISRRQMLRGKIFGDDESK